jgi:hypothetical protein
MIRTRAVRVLALGAIIAGTIATTIACGDDGDGAEASATAVATRTAAPATPQSTAEPHATSSGETIKVQGVVGAVDARAGIIEIRATGGSSVTMIVLAPGASIARPNGTAIVLDDVRPSDRIVAEGVAGTDPETLVADTVTVQQVVPGGQPGSNPGG